MRKRITGALVLALGVAALGAWLWPRGDGTPVPEVATAPHPAASAASAASSAQAKASASAPVKVAAAPPPGPSACDRFLRLLPSVSKRLCDDARLVDSGARSVKGVPLYTRDIAEPNAQVRVLVIGAIHGDELTSATVAMHWIALAAGEKMEMPQPVHWRFVPIVNPDGMLAKPHKRTNADGVDLNRNFPTPDWQRDAAIYWEKRTGKDPRRWPGPKPLSEPETRFVLDQVEHFRPHLIVSIHAPFGVLDFDGPTVPPSKLGRLYLDQVGIYPGSLGNYGGVHKGVPVITIELANALRAPREAEMRQMWLDLLRWTAAKIHADGGR